MQTIYDKLTNKVVSVETNFEETEEFGVTDLLCTENFFITKFNPISNQFYEGATTEEIAEYEKKRYNDLNIEYTQRISDLIEKHVQKNIIDGTPIPKEVLDERERLKQDFYSLTNKDLKKGLRNEASKIGFPIPPKKP